MTTLRALECLVAVLDTGSVTKAAATLHLSQPALSHQLAGLEREIGTPLLERLPRGVRPTTAGRAVADEARAALAAAERVVTVGQAVAKGTEGHLRIACAASMTAGLLAPVLRTWHRRRPGIQMTLAELTSADALADLVESGQADLAVGPRPTTWHATVDLIGTEDLVAAMTPSHPLATADSVSLADIAQYRTIGYDPENGLHAWLAEVLAGHGVALTPVMRTRQTTTAAELAAAGLGIALVPTTALPSGYTGTIRRLTPPLTRDIVVLTPAAGDPAVRALVNELVRRGLPVPKPIAARLTG
ncbi:LysR family transcriptional regulator [Kribbella monticola]|uniref:LysR family transcriptional regulator n=1 Tax=Kribbella monticola TaxID=2185285 RepID=UPI000DD4B9AD|nr:LysR family transcriptional regulator [Kribbella monticola]